MTPKSDNSLTLVQEAIDWARALEGTPKPETERAFAEWIGRSPRHVHHFLTQATLNEMLQEYRPTRRRSPAEWAACARQESIGNKPKWGIALALAAGLAALTLLVGITTQWWGLGGWNKYRSPGDAGSEVTLADGSVIDLYPGSTLKVRYDESRREVRMGQGTSQFDVQHDPDRPFVVLIPGASVQALGTVFRVSRMARETEVVVLEGAVRVDGRDSTARIKAGQTTRVASNGHVQPAVATKLSDVRRRTLAELAQTLNNMHLVPRLVVKGAARERRLTTIMALDDPNKLIAALDGLGEYRIERQGDIATIELKGDVAR